MTAVAEKTAEEPTPQGRRGRWIDHWEPEDPTFWEETGKKVAKKNLIYSVFAENLGFSVWVLFSILVTKMGDAGFAFMQGEKLALSNGLILTSIPVLVGSTLRLPYTFAIPKFGGRGFTAFSAAMLLIPTLGLAYFFTQPATPMWVFMILAGLAGFGGGNFSSSMANISFFFPEHKKGAALGINAAGGNIGVAITQLSMPLVITLGLVLTAKDPAGFRFALMLACLTWVPFILLASALAWFRMDSLTSAKPDGKSYKVAMKNPHTWIMSFLYIGTFGSFIGFSFAFPNLLKANFPEVAAVPWLALLGTLAFLGALLGSISRPFGGWMSDKLGGAKLTFGVFLGMAVGIAMIMFSLNQQNFVLYLLSFIFLFILTGIGNGSTYRMIPMIFSAASKKRAAETGEDPAEAAKSAKRQAGAALGVIGSIGAFGGFIVQQALRLSNVHLGSMAPAFWAYGVLFVVMGGVTWWFYLRKSFAVAKAPSLAYANV
jgi:NNP family nitrate/nitrite transporter-like MFS transporter